MERSGFFDANLVSGTYDRKYVSQDFADYFATFIGNGVFGAQLDELMVVQSDPNAMSVTLKPGRAWINGRWYENDKDMALAIGTANGTYARIDNIVIHWSKNDREIRAEVVEGIPGAFPEAPEVRRSEDEFDLKLAEVKIAAGALTITQTNITDFRDNAEACGFVKGLVDQIEASDYIKIATGALEDSFNTWFDGIKGQLSGDVAGNLQNQINDLGTKVDEFADEWSGKTLNEISGVLSPSKGGTGVAYEDPVFSIYGGTRSRLLFGKCKRYSPPSSENYMNMYTSSFYSRTWFKAKNGKIYALLCNQRTYDSSILYEDLLVIIDVDGSVDMKRIQIPRANAVGDGWFVFVSDMLEIDGKIICNAVEFPHSANATINGSSIGANWKLRNRKFTIEYDGTASVSFTDIKTVTAYSSGTVGGTTNIARSESGKQYMVFAVKTALNTYKKFLLTIDPETGSISTKEVTYEAGTSAIPVTIGSQSLGIVASDDVIYFDSSNENGYRLNRKLENNVIYNLSVSAGRDNFQTYYPDFTQESIYGSYPHGIFTNSSEETKFGKALAEYTCYIDGQILSCKIAFDESRGGVKYVYDEPKRVKTAVINSDGSSTTNLWSRNCVFDKESGKFMSVTDEHIADENGALLCKPYSDGLSSMIEGSIADRLFSSSSMIIVENDLFVSVYASSTNISVQVVPLKGEES